MLDILLPLNRYQRCILLKAILDDVAIPERRQTQPTRLRVQPRGTESNNTSFEDQSKKKCDNQRKLPNMQEKFYDVKVKAEPNKQKVDDFSGEKMKNAVQVTNPKAKATNVNTSCSESDDETAESLFAKKMSNHMSNSSGEEDLGPKAPRTSIKRSRILDSDSSSDDEDAEALLAQKSVRLNQSSNLKVETLTENADPPSNIKTQFSLSDSDSDDDTSEDLLAKKMNKAAKSVGKEASNLTESAPVLKPTSNNKSLFGDDDCEEDNVNCDSRAQLRSSLDTDLDMSESDEEVNETKETHQHKPSSENADLIKVSNENNDEISPEIEFQARGKRTENVTIENIEEAKTNVKKEYSDDNNITHDSKEMSSLNKEYSDDNNITHDSKKKSSVKEQYSEDNNITHDSKKKSSLKKEYSEDNNITHDSKEMSSLKEEYFEDNNITHDSKKKSSVKEQYSDEDKITHDFKEKKFDERQTYFR